MSPSDARRFLQAMTTEAPGLRHLTPWDRIRLAQGVPDDREAVAYAQVVRAHLMADHPSVFAPPTGRAGR